MADDDQARRERAERLRKEIDALKKGGPKRRPTSPREFTEKAAREEAEAESEREPEPDEA